MFGNFSKTAFPGVQLLREKNENMGSGDGA